MKKKRKKKTTNYQADKEHLFALSLSRKIKGSKSAAQPLFFCLVKRRKREERREKREERERKKERETLFSKILCLGY